MFRKEEGYWILRRLWEVLLGAGRGFLRSREVCLQGAKNVDASLNSSLEMRSLRWRVDGNQSRYFWPTTRAQLPDVDGSNPRTVARWGPIGELDFRNPHLSSISEVKRFIGTMGSEKYVPPARRAPKKVQDDRVILLFDLNGTLVSRGGKKKKSIKLRPGLHHLWRLKKHFRIGIFTSAQEHNLQRIRQSVESGISNEFDEDGLFDSDLILCRDHTRPKSRIGGKKWDTMKPLGPLFSDLSKVILFDDDAYKAAKGEAENMVILPSWKLECPKDNAIVHLVDILTEKLATFEGGDVRRLTSAISKELVERSTPPLRVVGLDVGPEELGSSGVNPSTSEVQGKTGECQLQPDVLAVKSETMEVGSECGVEVSVQSKDESSVEVKVKVVETVNSENQDSSNVVPLSKEFGSLGVDNDATQSKQGV